MQHDFSKCVIWLTGASSGMGAALARLLSATDCTLIISSRRLEALEAVAAECRHRPTLMLLDVTDKASTMQVVQAIGEKFGRLDIAIFNAGDCVYVDLDHFDVGIFEKMIHTNFLSAVYGAAAVLPLLQKAQQPHLVLMSSSAIYLPFPRAEAYGASKAAVQYFGNTLRVHLAPSNIPVTVIYPGFVKTPLTDKNDFPMPFLITAEQAAEAMFKGIQKYAPEICFPWRLIVLLKALSKLPIRWQVGLLKKLVRRT